MIRGWRRNGGIILLTLLCAWQLAIGSVAHPDFLSYFNELALVEPDRIVVDSDLDWGQDLDRLATELRARRVPCFSLAYFGTADESLHGLPPFGMLTPGRPASGWVAISVHHLRTEPGYAWLERYQPVSRIGKSVRLYYIDE